MRGFGRVLLAGLVVALLAGCDRKQGTGGGTNQPAPIIHNGVIYLNNVGNVMQAIDGRTGNLIWEARYGAVATAPSMRGHAIYDDKVIIATGDARLVARR